MTVDLAALAKLAAEATPGPWQRIGTLVARGIGGIARVENDGTDYSTGEDLWPETVEAVELADAAYIAAASPDVVAALVRVALAARAGPADNEPDCTCDRDDDSDPGGALTLCPKHERMMRPLRWETLAMMVIDLMANEAALRAALADLDA